MNQFDELPEGWAEVRFGEAITLKRGFDLPKQHRQSGSFPIYAANGSVGTHEEAKVKGPGVVTGRSGTIGKVHFIEEDFWPLNTALFVEDFHGNDPKFCAYLLRNTDLKKFSSSTAVPTLNRNIVHESDVALPPLNEQRRIVEKIEALTARSRKAREAIEAIPELLDQFRQSVLAAAFRGDLTADWREQNPDVEPAEALLERIRVERMQLAISTRDKNRLKKDWEELEIFNSNILPETWLKCSIGHIGNVCNGSTPSRKESSYWDGSISWVSSGEVQNNVISKTREKITETGFQNSSGRILPVGTVLIAMIGEGKTRGQTAILEIEATINQNIAAVILDHGLITSRYLWHWFRYQYSETRRVGSGSGPQALNCQRVREMPFILPPLAEQQVIVEQIDGLLALTGNIEGQHQNTEDDLDQLDQSILAKAFRGELVPQDPNDEPAAVLLERIRAERINSKFKIQNSKKRQQK